MRVDVTMGKQLAFVMGEKDEQAFIDFLKGSAEVVLIESFSKDKNLLFTDNIARELKGHFSYKVWNKKFKWVPAYSTTIHGDYYVSNTNSAPLVEFTRSRKYDTKKAYGRIYWSKYFLSNELEYNVDEFNKWYEQIARWIKKSAAGKIKDGLVTYFLPEAWETYLKDKENI